MLDPIEATGYTQNFIAKALKKSEAQTIGLVIQDTRSQYFIGVIHAINVEAAKRGYTVLLASSDDNPQLELEVIKSFCERRVDGIVPENWNAAFWSLAFRVCG